MIDYNRKVSVYDGVKDTQGVVVSIQSVLDRIKTGARGLDEKTRVLNALYQTERLVYKKEKEKLPAVAWSGTFPKGKRKHVNLFQHSGFIVLDIDSNIDLPSVLAYLSQHPNVAFIFVSPSGIGAKPVIPVYPIPTTPDEHVAAFQAVLEVFSEYAEQDPKELPKQRESNRLCFLAHDPYLIINDNVSPVFYDPDDADPQNCVSMSDLTPFEIDTDVSEYLETHGITFSPTQVTRQVNGVYQDVTVQASAYFPKALCPTEHSSNNKAVSFFQNDDGSIYGHCNGCKKHWVLQSRTETTPRGRDIKLTPADVISDVSRETLNDAEAYIKQVLDKDLSGQIFALRVDTGTGKSEKAILIKDVRPILLLGSHTLGEEIYERATAKGRKVFLYRGLLHKHGENFPYEAPCVQPHIVDEIRKKGANYYKWICKERCEAFSECQEHGMLFQFRKLGDQGTMMILAIPQLFVDPVYRRFLYDKVVANEQDVFLVDDASTESLFLDEQIRLPFLIEKIKIWKGAALADFAKAVKDILTEYENVEMIAELQKLFKRTDRNKARYNTLETQLGKARVFDQHTKNYVELDINDGIETGRFPIDTAEQRQKLQTTEKKGWTILDKLRIFFKTYPNPETAPMHFDEKEGILHFSLPPQFARTDAALGFMGATLDLDVFKSVSPKTRRKMKMPLVFDASSTEWHKDAKAYQLRNNRNPRATLLKYKGQGELSKTGLEFWNYIQNFVRVNTDNTHAIISYKSVIEHYKADLDELGDRLFLLS